MFITACNERVNSSQSVYDTCLTVFLSITIVTCFEILLIMDYRRRLVKLSFHFVGPQKELKFAPEIAHFSVFYKKVSILLMQLI